MGRVPLAPTPETRPRAVGHLPGSVEHRRISLALFAAGVTTFALLYSTQALLPELAEAFDVTATQSTLSLSLATAGLGVALLVAGTLSEVVGRTPLIHTAVFAAGVVAVACALAPTWHALLALRLVEGVTLAGLPAVATAYLREELHPSLHARAAGLYVGGTALGGMAGRLLPSAVADVAGWRCALGAVAVLALACAVVVRVLLPPSRRFEPVPARPRAVLAMTRRALTDPGLLALYGVGGCVMGAFIVVSNTLGFRLTAPPFDLGLGAAGLVFLVYPVGSASAALSGRLVERWGRPRVVRAGCLLGVVGALLTLLEVLSPVVAGLALLTAGFFVVHGVASGWVPARAHAAGVGAGQAASLYLFAYYLGSSVFGGLGAQVWTAAGWAGVVATSVGLLVATGMLTPRSGGGPRPSGRSSAPRA